MRVSKEAEKLCHVFDGHGDMYLVGGCVRDYFMGLENHDEDLTTPLTPDEIGGVLRQHGYPVIPVGAQFGTINTIVDGVQFEITTFRKEMGYTDGRHPDGVEYSRELLDDASRRDFTCNAMYYSMNRQELIDPYNGLQDIEDGVLCAVGDASDRFQEDALRMMRAVRICTIKGFDMDDSVMQAIQENKSLIQKVSAERKFAELSKILMSDRPDVGFRLLDTSGLLQEVLPEVAALKACSQNSRYHGENVFDHTMRALSLSEGTDVVRWSVLLHDIGKVPCRMTDVTGIDHFYGHPDVSKEMADVVLRRLRTSNEFRNDVLFCVGMHEQRYSKRLATKLTRLYVKNYRDVDLFERNKDAWFDVQKADILGQKGQIDVDMRLQNVENTRLAFAKLLSGPHRMEDLSVNGRDMMSAGMAPKEIPLMKAKLLHGLMLGQCVDRESQLQYVYGNRKVVHEEYIVQNQKERRLPNVDVDGLSDSQMSL